MDKFFDNVRRGPITTVMGALVILASLASVLTHKCTWAEAVVGLGFGAGLLGTKDPTTGTGTGAVGVVCMLMVLALGGCASTWGASTTHGTPAPAGLARWLGYYSYCCTAWVSICLVVWLVSVACRNRRKWWMTVLVAVSLVAVSWLAMSCRIQPKAPPYRFAPHQPSYLPSRLPRPIYRPRSTPPRPPSCRPPSTRPAIYRVTTRPRPAGRR